MSGAGDDEALADAVAELYALDRDQFVAARDAAAAELRTAGDKTAAAALKKLGRPTVSAWAINQLVRANPALAESLAALGVRLRDAQSALDAAELKALRPERDALLDEAVHAAATVAGARGQALAGGATDEVRATFVAALADPAAADAVTSGRLVRALSYAGFGEVELDDAVAALPVNRTGVTEPTDNPTPAQAEASRAVAAESSRDDDTARTDGTQDAGAARPKTSHGAADRARAAERELAAQRKRAEEQAREAERRRAAAAAADAENFLRDAERQATAAALAEVAAEDQRAAAHRRSDEIRTLLASAERDERAAADHADAAAREAQLARQRVATATAAWEDAKAARGRLAE